MFLRGRVREFCYKQDLRGGEGSMRKCKTGFTLAWCLLATLAAAQEFGGPGQAWRGAGPQPCFGIDGGANKCPAGPRTIAIRAGRLFDSKSGTLLNNQVVLIQGVAQSNERVSELLRNLGNNSLWLTKPELIEIVSANLALGKEQRRVANFQMKVRLLRSSEAQKAAAGASGASAATTAAPVAPAASAASAPRKT